MSSDSSQLTRRICGIVILSPLQAFYCDLVPSNKNRTTLVNSLIKAYELDKLSNVELISSVPLTQDQLNKFHDKDYIDFLMKVKAPKDSELDQKEEMLRNATKGSTDFDYDEPADDYNSSLEDDDDDFEDTEDLLKLKVYGLIYDCPVFPRMDKYVETIAGSTLSATNWIIDKSPTPDKLVSMNWHGGRHHGKKGKASGFCYVNDIILAISRLRSKFPKVMYVDLDLHHGDGVSQAFRMSNKVLTVSVHRYDIGFFPGTGDISRDKGFANGLGYDVNLPMRKGLSNKSLLMLTKEIIVPLIREKFHPDCLVIQCGCDGLNTDEHKEWNLTIKGLGQVVEEMLNKSGNIPVLLLGGGGYNHTELAKCWTYLTSLASGNKENWDLIPDHQELDAYEADSFEFWKNERETNMKDSNDDEWLQYLVDDVNARDLR